MADEKKPTPQELELIQARVAAERAEMRRRARSGEGGGGAHEGGAGAQGGAVDFGNPRNYSG
ncbi:MAG: hypothetical protein ACREB5_05700 [Sphingomonadaceae bacterium]